VFYIGNLRNLSINLLFTGITEKKNLVQSIADALDYTLAQDPSASK